METDKALSRRRKGFILNNKLVNMTQLLTNLKEPPRKRSKKQKKVAELEESKLLMILKTYQKIFKMKE